MKKMLAVACLLAASQAFAQNALDLDGTDDYVSTTLAGPSGGQARTVEAWIKTTGNFIPGGGGGVQGVLVDWGSSATGARSTFNVLWANAIRFEVAGSGLSGTIPVNDGVWHHVAMVYDPLATNKISLYVDGALDVSGNIPTTVNTATTVPIQIGRRVDGVNVFPGTIDEVRIWNVARSQAEIQADKDKEFCTYPAGLVHYYKLNEGQAAFPNPGVTTAADAVGNNPGTLQNFSLSGFSSNWMFGPTLSGGNSDSTYSVSACNRYTSPSGKEITSNGQVKDTIANAAGCDSLLTINVTINTVDTSMTASNGVFSAAATGAQYVWIDCATNQAVPGATSQQFTPTQNGSFAVVVTQNGCTDTSACRAIQNIGLQDVSSHGIKVYPNPARGAFTIESPAAGVLVVRSITGATVHTQALQEGNNAVQTALPNGVYVLEIRNDTYTGFTRLVVQN